MCYFLLHAVTFAVIGQISCILTVRAVIHRVQIISRITMLLKQLLFLCGKHMELFFHIIESLLVSTEEFAPLHDTQTGDLLFQLLIGRNPGINLFFALQEDMTVFILYFFVVGGNCLELGICDH